MNPIVNEVNTWTVKSTGVIRRLLLFYSGILLVGAFVWRKEELYLFTIPIGLLTIYYCTKNILNKKNPRELSITEEKLTMKYRSKLVEMPLSNLAFSFYDPKAQYKVLTMYKTFYGTRGQLVTNEIQELIAFKNGYSWTTHKVLEIKKALEELQVMELKDRKTNFLCGRELWLVS